jgi:serine/threonine-protein kinase RsbW
VLGVEQQADDLRLLIPADTEHLRAARLVAADAAGRAGFDCEETEDLRIAVDELCHSLMRLTDHPIVLAFWVDDGKVTIEGTAVPRSAEVPRLPALAETILRGTTDFFELVEYGGAVQFLLVKTRERL